MLMLLAILLSFGSVDALIPLLVIIILIASAAAITRGYDIFSLLGIGVLAGISKQAGGRGSFAGKTAFKGTSGRSIAGQFQKTPEGKAGVGTAIYGAGKKVKGAIQRSRATRGTAESVFDTEVTKLTQTGKSQSATQIVTGKPSPRSRLVNMSVKAKNKVVMKKPESAQEASIIQKQLTELRGKTNLAKLSEQQEKDLEDVHTLETNIAFMEHDIGTHRVSARAKFKTGLGDEELTLSAAKQKLKLLKAGYANKYYYPGTDKLKPLEETERAKTNKARIEHLEKALIEENKWKAKLKSAIQSGQDVEKLRKKFVSDYSRILDTAAGKTSQTRLLKSIAGTVWYAGLDNQKANQYKQEAIEEWKRSPRNSENILDIIKTSTKLGREDRKKLKEELEEKMRRNRARKG